MRFCGLKNICGVLTALSVIWMAGALAGISFGRKSFPSMNVVSSIKLYENLSNTLLIDVRSPYEYQLMNIKRAKGIKSYYFLESDDERYFKDITISL